MAIDKNVFFVGVQWHRFFLGGAKAVCPILNLISSEFTSNTCTIKCNALSLYITQLCLNMALRSKDTVCNV